MVSPSKYIYKSSCFLVEVGLKQGPIGFTLNEANFLHCFGCRTKSPELDDDQDHNCNWFGVSSSSTHPDSKRFAYEGGGRKQAFKSDKRPKCAKSMGQTSLKNRPRASNPREQTNQQKMVNLHNHAIPMMSLTFKQKQSNKKQEISQMLRLLTLH